MICPAHRHLRGQHFVGPDLGPNCLQRLSADDTSGLQYIKSFVSRGIGYADNE